MKKFIILSVFALMFAVGMKAQTSDKYYVFAADTVTNTDNATFTLPEVVRGKGKTISWSVNYTQLSGTTAFTGSRQQCNEPTGNNFQTVESWTTADSVLNRTVYGMLEQIYISSTGTHSTKIVVTAVVKD